MSLSLLYRHSLSLLTDLYQLTMAYGYWKCGTAEREAVFHLTFRNNPFGGGFAVACGLGYVVDWLSNITFNDDDVAYLETLDGEVWRHKIKLSEQPAKISSPGILQVRRFSNDGGFQADVIYNELQGMADGPRAIDQASGDAFSPDDALTHQDLLVPVFRAGRDVYTPPSATEARQTTIRNLAMLPDSIRQLEQPARYRVGLEQRLDDLKQRLIAEARGAAP